MPGERDLAAHHPDAVAVVGAVLLRGLHERGLRELRLAREGVHHVVGDVAGVVDDGELVALQARGREDVEERVGELGQGLLVPVEVARRLLLEPEPFVLRRLLQELRRLLELVRAAAPRRARRPRSAARAAGSSRGGSASGAARAPGRRGPRPPRGPPPGSGSGTAASGSSSSSPRRGRLLGRPRPRPRAPRPRGASAASPSGCANSARCGGGAERLALLARDLLGIGAVAALELQVLPNGVVEQAHARKVTQP